MDCPKCGVECVISAARNEAERHGEQVTVYTVQEFQCRNPACAGYGKKQGEKRHVTYDGIPLECNVPKG